MAQQRLVQGIILSLVAASSIALADPPTAVIATPPQPAWVALSPEQKNILAPLLKDWDQMENFRKKKWLGIAERFPKMTVDEQRRMQERMREWARLTPEERNRVRDSYKEFNQLPSEQKQLVKQKWESYNSLPEEDKERLKTGAKTTKPAPPIPPTPQPTATTEAAKP